MSVKRPIQFLMSLLLGGTSLAANYPLKVSSTNPHLLMDQSDVPFLIHGDCPWALMVTLNQAEAEEYLENDLSFLSREKTLR